MINKYRLASFPRGQMSVSSFCRSSDLPRSNRLPAHTSSGNRLNGTILWSSQQRDCTGFSPISLLIQASKETLRGTKHCKDSERRMQYKINLVIFIAEL